MTTPKETEARLKAHLDSDQAARERLCIAILKTDRRFSEVRPRHPKGGKDGGRDIEARFQNTDLAYGAVGFMNGANDSPTQKKQIKVKFAKDLKAALDNDLKPTVFVFMTNVALTVGEKNALAKVAKGEGVSTCEIFDRERLRVELDGVDGLAARVQYLEIPMSPAEQASFFARWGDGIQSLVAAQFQSVATTLSRIMFLQEARATLETLSVRFILDRTYSGDEIGHFRAFTSVFFPKMKQGITQVLFGSSDVGQRFHARPYRERTDRPGIKHGISSQAWESRMWIRGDPVRDPENAEADTQDHVPHGSGWGRGLDEVSQIVTAYQHTHTFDFQYLPRLSLEDIQGAWVMPKLNASLADKLEAIEIWADGYVLMSLRRHDFIIDKSRTDFPVLGHFSEEELADPWVRIRPSNRNSSLTIDFTGETPRRAFLTRETPEPFQRKLPA